MPHFWNWPSGESIYAGCVSPSFSAMLCTPKMSINNFLRLATFPGNVAALRRKLICILANSGPTSSGFHGKYAVHPEHC